MGKAEGTYLSVPEVGALLADGRLPDRVMSRLEAGHQ